jgi:hypothetical protein
MLPSSPPRALSTSSRTAQPRRYFIPSALPLSEPTRLTTPSVYSCCYEACGPSSGAFYILPGTAPRIPRRIVCPTSRTLPASAPPTTTLDGPIADTDHTAFDTPRASPVRSPSRARTQRASDHLAYGSKGRRPSTCMLTRRKYAVRARCASRRGRCVGHRNRAGGKGVGGEASSNREGYQWYEPERRRIFGIKTVVVQSVAVVRVVLERSFGTIVPFLITTGTIFYCTG